MSMSQMRLTLLLMVMTVDMHGVEQGDIQAWKNKRNAWTQAMWAHRTDVFYG
jgi:hypothetical protein